MGRLIYCFVARGATILAEYAAYKGKFKALCLQVLETLPPENNKYSIPEGDYTLTYLLENGYAYMVLADKDVPKEVAFGLLERIKTEFLALYGNKAGGLKAHSLDKEYGRKLKKQIKYAEENPGELSKLAKINLQIAEVKGIVLENIEEIGRRGEKLEVLQKMTDDLRLAAKEFNVTAGKIERKACLRNVNVQALMIGILVVVALVLYLSICRGFICR